ncbi:sensor histidine kinase [Lachnoclostridium sp. Marseille-P6806]|uniref:sensor histidine kinase n=1 Tax=Lachnoclostridium sp. Marseille-P6806 TaxID=2364793 RepID=UPI0013EF5778|nr:histidine kinase [Lachnoclostridium sp. Marseille-P6806]
MKWFLDQKISTKMLLGFIFTVLLPIGTLSLIMSRYNAYQTEKAYAGQLRQNAAALAFQLESSLTQISNYRFCFDNTKSIQKYLIGEYSSTSEFLFNYYDSIENCFSSYANDHRVHKIEIIADNSYRIYVPDRLISTAGTDDYDALCRQAAASYSGFWESGDDGYWNYYRLIYLSGTTSPIGLLRIQADAARVLEQFTGIPSEPLYLLSGDDVYCFSDGSYRLADEPEELRGALLDGEFLTVPIRSASFMLCIPMKAWNRSPEFVFFYFTAALFSMLFFSGIYFFLNRLNIGRIIDFNRFISAQRPDDLREYSSNLYTDEIGGVIAAYNQLVNEVNHLVHDNLEASLKMNEARYYALQAQIKPHFLYNILENIRASSEIHGDHTTAGMTEIFANYMRYAMNNDTRSAPLRNELNAARNFLRINQIRLGDQLQYSFSIETELDNISCPRFVFQTIIENSIRHGKISGIPLRISIHITPSLDNAESVLIRVADNGRGIDPAMLKFAQDILSSRRIYPATKHVGLRNINDRLRSHNPDRSGLSIHSASPPDAQHGTIVSFRLYRGGEP